MTPVIASAQRKLWPRREFDASAAFGAFTTQVRIVSSAAVQYRIDAAPTAVTTDTYLPPNWVEYITVSPGQKIAVIGTGTVNITEVS